MAEKRKICVVTGTRAEYGQLSRIIKLIDRSDRLELQLIATGMHLSPEFGLTYKAIEDDGIKIDRKVELLLSSDTPTGVSKAAGLGLIGFADAFAELAPDVVLVLGDRFEIFAAAAAAMFANIPVAHISGGEKTEGAFDESIRHALTKMARLHFPATEEYRQRVIQLGEQPDSVFCVGDPAIDVITHLQLLDREAFEQSIGAKLKKRNLLVTYHPATLGGDTAGTEFKMLLKVLDEQPDTLLIFTKPNADCYGRVICDMIDRYAAEHGDKALVFTSLGQLRYLSALQFVDAVVGNSSSGIVEAPTFKIGTINIGDRQQGRLQSASVIDCEPDVESLRQAFATLYSAEFQKQLASAINPYGEGGASEKIVSTLETFPLDTLRQKIFYDLPDWGDNCF